MSHTPIHISIRKAASAPDFLRTLLLRTIGNFLILSSLFMIGKTFYQPVREEFRYFFDSLVHKTYVVDTSTTSGVVENQTPKGGLASILNIKTVEIVRPEDPSYSIVIPKIGANARIIANVNAADEGEYLKALQKGVAHVLGSAFPGEGGHIFLFAHSTDYVWNVGTYNAVFYLLYKLETGDEVDLFYKNHRYVYKVIGKKEVFPNEVEYLTRKTTTEFLTLQTCWPPGTTLKRILVFATRAVE
ncbi:sortase [Candidatus Roizmanbacteria bacterium]|nr:sortase [Candidatus Roizmanbacteria bacterium]